MSVNSVHLLGRLGNDPELKYLNTGMCVCNFSVATSEKWKDKSGEKKDTTTWHRIVVWGKLAEICNQYLSKGREVFVEGKIQNRSWETEQGEKKHATEIVASNVTFLSGDNNKKSSAQESAEKIFDNDHKPQAEEKYQQDNLDW